MKNEISRMNEKWAEKLNLLTDNLQIIRSNLTYFYFGWLLHKQQKFKK